LSGVACTNSTSCFAVGHAGADALVERWNGSGWSVSPSPKLQVSGSLNGVSCPIVTSCFAVGGQDSLRGKPTLIERWNGTAWSLVDGPGPGSSDSLASVWCASTSTCVAIGSYEDLTFANQSFADEWDGSRWAITPALSDASQSSLVSVSCVSRTDCFAVGNALTNLGVRALVERWNGSTWSIVSTPTPPGAANTSFDGVSCASATFCFAIGTDDIPGAGTLTERWDGSTWSVVTSPAVDSLASISCVSTTMCFAVGYSVTGLGAELLIERWNGTKWYIRLLSNPSGFDNYLTSVSCASATNCAAVGFVGSDLADQNLQAHWNGKSWSLVVGFAESVSTPAIDLTGVSCIRVTCVAVGSESLQWNGKKWGKIAPAAGGSVSCVSPTSCLAVGSADASQWNGTTWTTIPGANPDGRLAGVSCVATTCFAVGSSPSGLDTNTLVERTNWATSVACATHHDGAETRFRAGQSTCGGAVARRGTSVSCQETQFPFAI